MLKKILGALIYCVAPVRSGARYSQNLAANISNPPLLLPMPVALEISQRCYRLATLMSKSRGSSRPVEFEGALQDLTVLAVEYIQGAYDDDFKGKTASLQAHAWLPAIIASSGINAVGISKRPILTS